MPADKKQANQETRNADRFVLKLITTGGLRLGRSEMLRILRQYLQAQNQRHQIIDGLQERVVEKKNRV